MSSAYPGAAIPGATWPNSVTFTPPFVLRRLVPTSRVESRPFHKVNGKVGLTVLKVAGSYSTIENPTDEQVAGADIAYLGGRAYLVDSTEASALIAAGYEVNTP